MKTKSYVVFGLGLNLMLSSVFAQAQGISASNAEALSYLLASETLANYVTKIENVDLAQAVCKSKPTSKGQSFEITLTYKTKPQEYGRSLFRQTCVFDAKLKARLVSEVAGDSKNELSIDKIIAHDCDKVH